MMTNLIAMERKLEKYHEMPKIKAADLIERGTDTKLFSSAWQNRLVFTEKYILITIGSLLNSLLYCLVTDGVIWRKQ